MGLRKYGAAPGNMADVWKDPAPFNRATRRWAGLYGDIWRHGPDKETTLPRYVRRNYQEATITRPRTRRERRHRARILRAMADQT